MAPGAKEKRRKTRPVVGRPPKGLAGEVDERILDAARAVFLKSGLGGASIDEIARLAPASKPTIYARFPSKEALFIAVGMRNQERVMERFGSSTPAGDTLEERLVNAGTGILQRLLTNDTIDFVRLAIAEARRFPQLTHAGRAARERAVQAIAEILREIAPPGQPGGSANFAPGRLMLTAQFYTDLVVTRFFMRALFGESLKQLREEIGAHVVESVAFFLRACR